MREERGQSLMSTEEERRVEIEQILKRLNRYKLPKDLTAEEQRIVDLLDSLGYSEMDKAIRIMLTREPVTPHSLAISFKKSSSSQLTS